MAVMASIVALPVGSSSLPSSHAPKLLLRSSSSSSSVALLRCNASVVHHHQSGSSSFCAETNKKGAEVPEKGGPLKISAVVVPMLAAALVGCSQPAVQAAEWDKFLVPVDNAETSSGQNVYNDLLEIIKAKKFKEKTTPTAPTEENSDAEASSNLSPFFSPAPIYSSPPTSAPPTRETPTAKTPEPAARTTEPAAEVYKPSPAVQKGTEVVAQVEGETTKKQKTHGFLPLFLSQFLVLVATVGGGYILITTPGSKWEEVQKTLEGYIAKATPVVEDSWTKAKPVAIQAQKKAKEYGEKATPYLVKAWEASKPLAAKAVEASKPILKGAQIKAAELLEQAKSKRQ